MEQTNNYCGWKYPTATQYLNNEILLYDFIVKNRNSDNAVVVNDSELAKDFNVSTITILRWRNSLKTAGLIKYSSKWVKGKKSVIIWLI